MPRSAASVVSAHQRRVASFDPGRTARAISSANATSRIRDGSPSSSGNPSLRASACTAATCPCGRDRSSTNPPSPPPPAAPAASAPDPASARWAPASTARTAAIASSDSADRFARFSCLTLPASR